MLARIGNLWRCPWQKAFAAVAFAAGIGLTLFRHWEMTGETWGYWFFARVFSETGNVSLIDRSPIYALYLDGFRWLGYPTSVTVEYIFTSAVVMVALAVLFKPYLGLPLSVVAALLWLPFLQVEEPPVQILALACSCWAVVSRRESKDRFRVALSYALLILAVLFRSTYGVLILLFLAWDIWQYFKSRQPKAFHLPRLHLRKDGPVLLVIALIVLILIMQSPHRWNNAWIATTTWFPGDPKSLTTSSLIGHYNWRFIQQKYGTFETHDLYFTNREVFGDATDLQGMAKANPQFIMQTVRRNFLDSIPMMGSLTMLPKANRGLLDYPIIVIAMIAVIYGALRASRDRTTFLFVVGGILLIGASIMSYPKTRYMFPIIPVLILGASWYASKISSLLSRVAHSGPKIRFLAQPQSLVLFIILVLLSNGPKGWQSTVTGFVEDAQQGQLRIMEDNTYSMKAAFPQLQALLPHCNGVMSLEHTFVASFIDVPIDKVYDIWEIPPFGQLGNAAYDGLRPDRVDCVLVSRELSTGIGFGTNYRIRFQNYIAPYLDLLRSMGATTYSLKGFGDAVVLPAKTAPYN